MPPEKRTRSDDKPAEVQDSGGGGTSDVPGPCGGVGVHVLPDLADGGVRDGENIIVCGDAHYIYQLGADVSEAVGKVVEAFLEGQFVPDSVPDSCATQDLLCRYVSARVSRLPGEYVTKVLTTTFDDERVDEVMNSLAATFDTFECSYAIGQPAGASLWLRTERHALLREIFEVQSVFSEKGGGGVRLIVDQAGAGLVEGLAIAAAPEVQCHAGVRVAGDPIATLAALTDKPAQQIRARALKASAVRYVAQTVAGFLTQPLDDLMEADLGKLSEPLSKRLRPRLCRRTGDDAQRRRRRAPPGDRPVTKEHPRAVQLRGKIAVTADRYRSSTDGVTASFPSAQAGARAERN
jgi:hypothetical protein